MKHQLAPVLNDLYSVHVDKLCKHMLLCPDLHPTIRIYLSNIPRKRPLTNMLKSAERDRYISSITRSSSQNGSSQPQQLALGEQGCERVD